MPVFDLLGSSDVPRPLTLSGGQYRVLWARRCVWVCALPIIAGLLLVACSPENPPVDPPPSALPAHPRMLVFGDSYTEGSGAEPSTQGFAYQLGDQLGWEVTVDGAAGTGYLAVGPYDKGPFLKRLATAAAGPFDLIVIQGSSNDEKQPLAQLGPAVDATVTAVRAKYPTARVVLMGPVNLYNSLPPSKEAVNGTLKTYAASHEMSFVDPIAETWFGNDDYKTMVNQANGHPNNAGHLRIRDRLAVDLSRLAFSRPPG